MNQTLPIRAGRLAEVSSFAISGCMRTARNFNAANVE